MIAYPAASQLAWLLNLVHPPQHHRVSLLIRAVTREATTDETLRLFEGASLFRCSIGEAHARSNNKHPTHTEKVQTGEIFTSDHSVTRRRSKQKGKDITPTSPTLNRARSNKIRQETPTRSDARRTQENKNPPCIAAFRSVKILSCHPLNFLLTAELTFFRPAWLSLRLNVL